MTKQEAISAWLELTSVYGLKWRADVPREAWDRLNEVNNVLSADEKREALMSKTYQEQRRLCEQWYEQWIPANKGDSLSLFQCCWAAWQAALMESSVDDLMEALEGLLSIEDSVTQGQERERRDEWVPKARAAIARAKDGQRG